MTAPARVVFVVLVLATMAAFFLTQRLRHAPALVLGLRETRSFTPTRPGPFRVERISFQVSSSGSVTVTVIDAAGHPVVTLARMVRVHRYRRLRLSWDGRGAAGALAPPGTYQIRILLIDENRTVVLPRTFRLLAGA